MVATIQSCLNRLGPVFLRSSQAEQRSTFLSPCLDLRPWGRAPYSGFPPRSRCEYSPGSLRTSVLDFVGEEVFYTPMGMIIVLGRVFLTKPHFHHELACIPLSREGTAAPRILPHASNCTAFNLTPGTTMLPTPPPKMMQ